MDARPAACRRKERLQASAGYRRTGPSAADIAAIGGKLSAKGLAAVGGQAAARKLHQEEIARTEQLGKRFVSEAIANASDRKTALILAATPDPTWLRLVTGYKRPPGRAKGEPRPSDLPATERSVLDQLSRQVAWVHQLWQPHGKKVKAAKDTAQAIVIRRFICLCKGVDTFDDMAFAAAATTLKRKLDTWDSNATRRRK